MISKFEPILNLHNEWLKNEAFLNQAKKAAVSLIINSIQAENPTLILIKRNEYDGHHSGQMAFPGGKMDLEDSDLLETAKRESLEEIGVELLDETSYPLNPIWVKVSNFAIYPYLFFVNKNLTFDLNKREINRIFEIPVSTFRDTKFLKAHQLNILGKEYWSPYFEIENEIIWGATALIIYQNIFLKDPFTEIKYE